MWGSTALPSLTRPSLVRPGRTGCAGADSAPAPAQQGDPSGAGVVLTVHNIPGN